MAARQGRSFRLPAPEQPVSLLFCSGASALSHGEYASYSYIAKFGLPRATSII